MLFLQASHKFDKEPDHKKKHQQNIVSCFGSITPSSQLKQLKDNREGRDVQQAISSKTVILSKINFIKSLANKQALAVFLGQIVLRFQCLCSGEPTKESSWLVDSLMVIPR